MAKRDALSSIRQQKNILVANMNTNKKEAEKLEKELLDLEAKIAKDEATAEEYDRIITAIEGV